MQRALLTPAVNPGSPYRCAKSSQEQPVTHGRRKGGLKSAQQWLSQDPLKGWGLSVLGSSMDPLDVLGQLNNSSDPMSAYLESEYGASRGTTENTRFAAGFSRFMVLESWVLWEGVKNSELLRCGGLIKTTRHRSSNIDRDARCRAHT